MTLSFRPLPRSFYARPVLTVARALVGTYLVHEQAGARMAGRVVETEAYRGPEDRAAHSYGGRRTARTEVMFGPAGYAYLFLVYGLHWQFNVVTGRVGEPEAVLIRALEPVEGVGSMALRRGKSRAARELTNGPGKLCQAMGIDGSAYGRDLTSGSLAVCSGPTRQRSIGRSPRIGVAYAGAWAKRPWRFCDDLSPYVSRPSAPPPAAAPQKPAKLARNG